MAREREKAGRDILHPIEQEVSTEASKVVAFRLEGKNTTGGSKLGGIEGIKADVSANVVEDIAIAQIFVQPLYCLGLLGSVGVRAMVFVRCRDANGDGEPVDIAARDWKNRTPGCTKRQHHRQRYSVQLGKEPSTHLIVLNLGSCHKRERHRGMHRKRRHRTADTSRVLAGTAGTQKLAEWEGQSGLLQLASSHMSV